jgi:predicted acylesterase/phospholipase RssA
VLLPAADPPGRDDDRCPLAAVATRTGFVLAGGGFKGAFELGALRHLIDDLGIAPDVIASASAGSILGMVLAQGRTHAEFSQQLGSAQQTLLAMTHADLVFGRQEWLGEFDGTAFADRVIAMVTDRSSPDLPTRRPSRAPAATAGAAAGRSSPRCASSGAPRAVPGARSAARPRRC